MPISNKYKLLIIVLLILLIIILFYFEPLNNEVSFELDDRCGPMINLISHTIPDESACRIQCRSQCNVKDIEFNRVDFEQALVGCNNCTCYCS